MQEYGFLVDTSRCVYCHACEIACKVENNLPAGVKWREVIKLEGETSEGLPDLQFVSMACMHCAEAPCIRVCPVNAISKRNDGIVLIDDNACIGCKYCLSVCPFGAPQLDFGRKLMTKCTMCVHRVEHGGVPACVETCHTKAIIWGPTDQLASYVRTKAARSMSGKSMLVTPR